MKRLAALMLLALVAACGNLPGPLHGLGGEDRYWLRPGLGRPSSDAVSLLHYFDYLRSLSPAEQSQEQERVRKAYAKDKSDFHRVQLSMALEVPTASAADRRQGLALLEPLAKETKGHDPDLHLLAEMLWSQGRRGDDLERKLEAMKDIERNLLQRDRGGQK